MTACNQTELVDRPQDVHLYHVLKLSTLSLGCIVNVLLSVPLLLVVSRPPSLLSSLQFLLLAHLLCCDNLQLLAQLAKAATFICLGSIPVTYCLGFSFVSSILSVVVLLINAALAVDRCVAVKYPLRYESLVSLLLRRSTVAVLWILPLVLGMINLCLALKTVQVNAFLTHCSYMVMMPCLFFHHTLKIISMLIGSSVVLLCYMTMLICIALLCWDTRGLVSKYRRGAVTLALQMLQSFIYLVFVVLESQLLPITAHSEIFDLTANLVYSVAVSLIPLVYGYRSRQLLHRLQKIRKRNQITAN